MDTRPAENTDRAPAQVALIKDYMPAVYAAIQAKSTEIGREAFSLVRRAANGEADCFYAAEGGRVVGTPFCQDVMAEVAVLMVHFGATFFCIWPLRDVGGANGSH